MIPSMDLVSIMYVQNHFTLSYPDVVIACIEHKVSLEAFRAIEQRW